MDDLEIAARNLLDMNMETGPLLKLVNSVQFLYKSQKVFPEYPNILEELDKFARGLNWFLEVALRDSVIDNRVENGRVVMRPSYQSKIETVLRKLVSVGPWPHPASFEEFSKWGCKFLGQTPDIEKKIVHLGA
jgi:hypothetical protein